MPVEYAGFMLKPNGFFSANAAMDLPAGPNEHSVDHRDKTKNTPAPKGDCCH